MKMKDDYCHLENNIFYIDESIPGPEENSQEYKEIINNFNSELVSQCSCGSLCSAPSCSCIASSGNVNYYKFQTGNQETLRLNIKNNGKKSFPILECNKLCSCSDNCGNRLVQSGPLTCLDIKDCKIKFKSKGLFTKKNIAKGTFICEYAGELITKNIAMKRHSSNKQNGGMNYIFCLKEHSQDSIIQTFVDPTTFGNIGRYINHSCDPNSYIIPVRVWNPIPKLAIFSCKDINEGEEITFHYGPHSLPSSIDTDKTKCYCLSPNCTGVMPYESY